MADIKTIKLPDGTSYDIKDATARSSISSYKPTYTLTYGNQFYPDEPNTAIYQGKIVRVDCSGDSYLSQFPIGICDMVSYTVSSGEVTSMTFQTQHFQPTEITGVGLVSSLHIIWNPDDDWDYIFDTIETKTVTSSSTHYEVPTALAVKNYVDTAIDGAIGGAY